MEDIKMAVITEAFVNQYKANIELLAQQMGSKLTGAVRVEMQDAEYSYYDQLTKFSTLTTNPARNADTVIISSNHERRRVSLNSYFWADLVDKFDEVRMLADPKSPYAVNAAYLFGRQKDSNLLGCAGGTAYTGKAGGTSTTFTGTMSIPTDETLSGTNYAWSGSTTILNQQKILGAKYLLDLNDVPSSDRYFVGHPKGLTDLLQDTTLTSIDYNSVKALVRGEVDTFLGFTFIWTTLVDLTTGVYTNYAWHKNSMLLTIGQDDFGFNAKVEQRADKNYSTQIFNSMFIGCTRMDELGVVRIYST
jgi:hypothetical protein